MPGALRTNLYNIINWVVDEIIIDRGSAVLLAHGLQRYAEINGMSHESYLYFPVVVLLAKELGPYVVEYLQKEIL